MYKIKNSGLVITKRAEDPPRKYLARLLMGDAMLVKIINNNNQRFVKIEDCSVLYSKGIVSFSKKYFHNYKKLKFAVGRYVYYRKEDGKLSFRGSTVYKIGYIWQVNSDDVYVVLTL